MYRSLLFVPGDSDKKIAKSETVPADLIIFDLEDAVAAGARPEARLRVREYLKSKANRTSVLFVRINPLNTDDAEKDLQIVMDGAPDGIVLPKAHAPDDIRALENLLDDAEKKRGLGAGSTRIIGTIGVPAASTTMPTSASTEVSVATTR